MGCQDARYLFRCLFSWRFALKKISRYIFDFRLLSGAWIGKVEIIDLALGILEPIYKVL